MGELKLGFLVLGINVSEGYGDGITCEEDADDAFKDLLASGGTIPPWEYTSFNMKRIIGASVLDRKAFLERYGANMSGSRAEPEPPESEAEQLAVLESIENG
jgi:hypothetical protein